MDDLLGEEFVWVIKMISPLQPKQYVSDLFVIGGCKWRLLLTTKENKFDFSYHYLGVGDPKPLHSRWRRSVHLHFNLLNPLSEYSSIMKDSEFCFDEKSFTCHYPIIVLSSKLLAEDGGFLKRGKLRVVVRASHSVEATETLGESDNSSRKEENHGIVDVNGLQVFPSSQVESVKRILERYPAIASEVRPKNRFLRTTYMYVILGVIKTLCQLPEEISDDDLEEASFAVSYAAKGRFKVDWLEKKLEEVKEKKKKVDTGKARLQQIEEEFQKLHRKCLDLKDILEKEYAAVSVANVPFSFDDVVDVLKF